MVQGSSTMAVLAAGISWLALALVGVARATGGTVPRLAALAAAYVAAPVALAAAVQYAAAFWRGPNIVAFGLSDAVSCTPAEAAFIRSRAQLRGMMGGAGFLYPRRLALPVVAWLAAAVVGASVLSDRVDAVAGPWPVVLSTATALAAIVLPSRPFFYRDTTGGGAVLSPPSAAYRLKKRAELAGARSRGEAVEASTPAPTPAPPSALGRRVREP